MDTLHIQNALNDFFLSKENLYDLLIMICVILSSVVLFKLKMLMLHMNSKIVIKIILEN